MRVFAALALLAVVLAGCTTTPTPPAGPGAPEMPAAGLANVKVTHAMGPASEVTLAVNPLDPDVLVGGAKDYTLGADPGPGCPEFNVWSGLYWSQDGGQSWGNALMPGFPGDANTTLLSHYTCNSDPVVVYGPDGTVYYSGLAYGGARASSTGTAVCPGDAEATLCGRSIWIAKSTDGGLTWENFVNVVAADDGGLGLPGAIPIPAGTILDKQWFAVDPSDPQHLAMTWIHFATFGGGFYISESRDGAATWTPPVLLTELAVPLAHQFAMPAFGPDGTLYVVWRNFVGGPGSLPSGGADQVMFTKTSTPDTFAFSPARAIATIEPIPSPLNGEEVRVNSMPILAVDGASGALYLAWPEQRGDQADIVVIASTDAGETWSSPVTVGAAEDGADQFMPWMVVDELGGVDLVYYDRSYTNNTLLDLTLARSVDGGQSFGTLRLTTQSWAIPEGCFHQGGFPFIGDYIALAAAEGTLHPFWADGREGRCDIFTAAVPYTAIPAPAPAPTAEA